MNDLLLDRAALDAVLRQDLYAFLQAMFRIAHPGQQISRTSYLEAITYALTRVWRGETKRLLIMIPPRSLKSFSASVVFPLFVLGHDPTRKIICVSYSDGLARKFSNDTRALMRSPLYRRLFPSTGISSIKDTEAEFTTSMGGGRRSTSVGGTLTGLGANLIILDDPLKAQDAYSESARDNLKQWFRNTLMSRLDNKAEDPIVVVTQRLHVDDLPGYLIEQGGWESLTLPAIAETEQVIPIWSNRTWRRMRGDLLDPDRHPAEVLDAAKRDMGSLDFAAQYQQEPVAPEGNLIKWNWFHFYDEPPFSRPADRVLISWDTALSGKDLSSYSVCVVMQVRGESCYVIDLVRARLEYPDLRRKVLEVYRRWSHAAVYCDILIENKGSGMSLIQDLRREHIHAVAVDVDTDKISRMNEQTAQIEAGAVYLPKNAHWLDEFRREIMQFPAGRYNDQVDALSQALRYVRTMDSRRAFTAPLIGLY